MRTSSTVTVSLNASDAASSAWLRSNEPRSRCSSSSRRPAFLAGREPGQPQPQLGGTRLGQAAQQVEFGGGPLPRRDVDRAQRPQDVARLVGQRHPGVGHRAQLVDGRTVPEQGMLAGVRHDQRLGRGHDVPAVRVPAAARTGRSPTARATRSSPGTPADPARPATPGRPGRPATGAPARRRPASSGRAARPARTAPGTAAGPRPAAARLPTRLPPRSPRSSGPRSCHPTGRPANPRSVSAVLPAARPPSRPVLDRLSLGAEAGEDDREPLQRRVYGVGSTSTTGTAMCSPGILRGARRPRGGAGG